MVDRFVSLTSQELGFPNALPLLSGGLPEFRKQLRWVEADGLWKTPRGISTLARVMMKGQGLTQSKRNK